MGRMRQSKREGVRDMAANPRLGAVARPVGPSDLEAAIQRSRGMLDLPDNWDDDGGSRIDAATWERVTSFLRDNTLHLWSEEHVYAGAPLIFPVGDGSIDIHWRDERRQLLINVPAAGDEPIEFYGDDRGRTVVKGIVDPSVSTRWLFAWLTT